MLRAPPKLMLIFNLQGTLCSKVDQKFLNVYEKRNDSSLILRKNLEALHRFLFVRNRLFFKIGIWTNSSASLTEHLSSKVFGVYDKQILFKYASPAEGEKIDLNRVWYNYPEYNAGNTAYIDSNPEGTVQKHNLLVLPKFGEDESLNILQDYLKFFCFQYVHKKTTNFYDFMRVTPFTNYVYEHSKTYSGPPMGEASRFN